MPTGTQAYAVLGIVITIVAAMLLVAVVFLTGHDLSNPEITQLLGFAGTVIIMLFGLLGVNANLASKVQDVHLSINSRMDQLVDSTASSSFQQGQAAGPGAPIPPSPSKTAPPTTGA